MRDTFFLPGFRHRELIHRPRVHFCGVWADECWKLASAPPSIGLMGRNLSITIQLPHRHQVTGWVDAETRQPVDNPRQLLVRFVIWDSKRKRYWWPLQLERERRARLEWMKSREDRS